MLEEQTKQRSVENHNTVILTDEQKIAYDAIGQSKSLFISGGAGCGKSILITEKVKASTTGKIVLCATTNQAARVLAEKLGTGYNVPTLHSVLRMRPVYDGSTKESTEIIDFEFTIKPILFFDLKGQNLIIDEASIISKKIQDYILEILKYGHINSVTFVGDKYQLSSVNCEPFDYNKIENIIELTLVQRAENQQLLDYYNTIRSEVIENRPLSAFTGAKYFEDMIEFAKYMKSATGSKIIISYTNKAADACAEAIDSATVYEGQVCTALASCYYKHLEQSETLAVETNSKIIIKKIFRDYSHMTRDAIDSDYEFTLPKEPINMEITNLSYAKIENNNGKIVYISIWDASLADKESLYLNNMTKEYRKLQDSIKSSIPISIWNTYAKDDGYLKSLSKLNGKVNISKSVLTQDKIFWHNFHVIKDALPLRSHLSTTAYRAQGITVDVAGVNLDDIQAFDNLNLEYVSLTRAAKELVILGGYNGRA